MLDRLESLQLFIQSKKDKLNYQLGKRSLSNSDAENGFKIQKLLLSKIVSCNNNIL